MRHISTLTFEEGAGLWDSVMPAWIKKPFQGSAYRFDADEDTPQRVVFMSGCERLGVYFNGRIWADSDMVRLELDHEKIREYLSGVGILLS